MPTTPNKNDYVIIKDKGNSQTNVLTVHGSGNSIDGQASKILSSNYAAMTLVWDTAEWIII